MEDRGLCSLLECTRHKTKKILDNIIMLDEYRAALVISEDQ